MPSEYDQLLEEPPKQASPYDALLTTDAAALTATPATIATPSVGQIARTAGEAAVEVGKEFVQGLVPHPDLATLTEILFPPATGPIEAYKQGQGVAQTVKRVQEAEKTPPFSKERFEAGFSTVAQIGMLAAGGRGVRGARLSERLGFEEPRPEAVPETRPATPATDQAVRTVQQEREVTPSAPEERQVESSVPVERPRDDTGGPPAETSAGGGVRPATEGETPQVIPEPAAVSGAETPPAAETGENPKIISTAVRQGEEVVTGDRWNQAHNQFSAGAPEENKGFLVQDADGTQRFAGRDEAAQIAKESGQVPATHEGPLHSEALIETPKGPSARQIPIAEEPIKVRPLTALKSVYQAAEKAGTAGFKRGLAEAREEGKSALTELKGQLSIADKWMAGDQETVRQNMVDFVNAYLPPAERGRFTGAITRALRRPDLIRGDSAVMYRNAFRVMRAIENRAEEVYKGSVIEDIKSTLDKSVDAPGIDVQYRRGIKNLLDQIGLTKPSAKTLRAAQSLQDFIDKERAAGREPQIPKEHLEQLSVLSKLPLRDMSANALDQLKNEVENFVSLGRLKTKLMERSWEANKQRTLKEMESVPADPIESRELYRAQPTERLSAGQRFINRVRQTLNGRLSFEQALAPMDEIYDHFDGSTGRYDGWASRNIRGQIDLGFNKSQAEVLPLKEQSRAIIKQHGLKQADLETIGIKGIVNMIGRDRLEEMGVRGDILDRIEKTPLTKGQQAYYDFTRKAYDDLGARVQDIGHRLYQHDINIIDNYVPLDRDWVTHSDREPPPPMESPKSVPFDETATMRQLQHDMNPKAISRTEQGFLKERIEGAKTAVKLNAQDVFERHINDALHFVHSQPTLKMLGEVARTPEFEAKYGKLGQQIVLDHLDTVANQGYVNHWQRVGWLDWIRNSTSKGAVGFRIASNIVHTSQIPFASYHAGGPQWWAKGLELALTEKGQQFLRQNAAETYVRSGGEPAQADVEAISKLGRAGFFVARNIDKLNAQATFLGRYVKEMQKKGVPVENVLDTAADRQTQGLALRRMRRAVAGPQAKDLPQMISRGKAIGGNVSIARAINQFRNIFLDNWSNIRHDFFRAGVNDAERVIDHLRQGELGAGAKEVGDATSHRIAIGTAVLASIAMETGIKLYVKAGVRSGMAALTGVTPSAKKEEETYLGDFKHHALMRAPFAGQFAGMFLYGETGVPVIDAIVGPAKELGTAFYRSRKPETTAKHLVRAASGFGTLAGVSGSSQVIEAAEPKASQMLGEVLPDRSTGRTRRRR